MEECGGLALGSKPSTSVKGLKVLRMKVLRLHKKRRSVEAKERYLT